MPMTATTTVRWSPGRNCSPTWPTCPPAVTCHPMRRRPRLFELSLFMLEGHLDGILDEDRVALTAGDALHIPRGMPFGVENKGSDTVSFVLSFAPPPPNVNLDTMKESALERGRVVIEAADVEDVVGPITFPG